MTLNVWPGRIDLIPLYMKMSGHTHLGTFKLKPVSYANIPLDLASDDKISQDETCGCEYLEMPPSWTFPHFTLNRWT